MITRESPCSFRIETDGKVIDTPFYFPAISTIKTNFDPLQYLELIHAVGYPGFLISSYDIYKANAADKKKVFDILSKRNDKGIIALLDSGNYEAYWNIDKNWKISKFNSVLKKAQVDLALSFDVFWDNPSKINPHVKETLSNVLKAAAVQKTGLTVPIIHSTFKKLPSVTRKIVQKINPEIIAIPERELGDSIYQRAITIKIIRKELDKTGRDIALHLLGTGNPISILIYSVCGADTFDGLEWCQTVVNHKNASLYHFSQKDLFECDCASCMGKNMPYPIQTLAHNLVFYSKFMEKLVKGFRSNNVDDLLSEYLPPQTKDQIKEIAGIK